MNTESTLAGGKHLILIVEDSLPQAVFLRRTLEKAGYDVAAAANGVEPLTCWNCTRQLLSSAM